MDDQVGTGNPAQGGDGLTRPADPCAIVIFGASGDLTKRKLLPSLYNLRANGLLPPEFAFVGVARTALDDASFRARMGEALQAFATRPVDSALWDDFSQRLHAVSGDLEDPATYRRLADRLEELEREHHTAGNVVFYLATPSDAFAHLVRRLGEAGLLRQDGRRWRRVVVEKPFGRDLESARVLDAGFHAVLQEDQIFRIDHYLGKETVQNILVFRFANGILEPIWNRRYVDHVQITVAEAIGVEGRGTFYDRTGALRDVVQNHVFQVMSLVAMEPPSSLAPAAVRAEKTKVLEAIRPLSPDEVPKAAVRGQYAEGVVDGRRVPGYRQEPGVGPSSQTETYAALRLQVENWRWAGVPFYVRTGKRLDRRHSSVSIQFKGPPLALFRGEHLGPIDPNRLDIHIQPDESIALQMKAKLPGASIRLAAVQLSFGYQEFGPVPAATGYERLLYDVMVGDSTLFHCADEVDAAWRALAPVQDAWASTPARDFPDYAAGTGGPAAADELLRRDGRRWVDLE
jgi:glucose-6-phosphate 1-dehydrogenase